MPQDSEREAMKLVASRLLLLVLLAPPGRIMKASRAASNILRGLHKTKK